MPNCKDQSDQMKLAAMLHQKKRFIYTEKNPLEPSQTSHLTYHTATTTTRFSDRHSSCMHLFRHLEVAKRPRMLPPLPTSLRASLSGLTLQPGDKLFQGEGLG